jgi:hypothetical protein
MQMFKFVAHNATASKYNRVIQQPNDLDMHVLLMYGVIIGISDWLWYFV